MTNTNLSIVAITSEPDAELAALFHAYCDATKAFDEQGDSDNQNCPFQLAFHRASDAMSSAPVPQTTLGATYLLRYALCGHSKTDELNALLYGDASDRRAFFEQIEEHDSADTWAAWSALVGLEANLAEAASRSVSADAALWRIAVSEYEAERAREDAFSARYHAACKAVGGELTPEVWTLEEEHDPIADALHDARDRMFKTPAPDADALFYKLDLLLPYMAEGLAEDTARVEAIANDIRRLLGAE